MPRTFKHVSLVICIVLYYCFMLLFFFANFLYRKEKSQPLERWKLIWNECRNKIGSQRPPHLQMESTTLVEMKHPKINQDLLIDIFNYVFGSNSGTIMLYYILGILQGPSIFISQACFRNPTYKKVLETLRGDFCLSTARFSILFLFCLFLCSYDFHEELNQLLLQSKVNQGEALKG